MRRKHKESELGPVARASRDSSSACEVESDTSYLQHYGKSDHAPIFLTGCLPVNTCFHDKSELL